MKVRTEMEMKRRNKGHGSEFELQDPGNKGYQGQVYLVSQDIGNKGDHGQRRLSIIRP